MKGAIVIGWLLFALGAYLTLANRGARQLGAEAKLTATWDERRGHEREPSREQLVRLSAQAREAIDMECYRSGGDTLGTQNCYASAAEWLHFASETRQTRTELGYLLLLVGLCLAGVATWLKRRQSRLDAALRAA